MTTTTMKRIANGDISDLFFNHDIATAAMHDAKGGAFTGYDEAKLLDIATEFLGYLERLGVGDLPTPSELVEDFLDRV